MELNEAYKVLQAACGIESGDKVKLVRLPFKGAFPFKRRTCVVEECQRHLGGVFSANNNDDSISLGLTYNVPFYCLELVEKAKPKPPPIKVGDHTVEFTGDGIKVGCEVVSKKTLGQIWRRVNKGDC